MSLPDTINAGLELGGALFSALNIVHLYRDRIIKGVAWPATAFFTAWGVWNLWYYPHLAQPLSALAALALVLVNATWLLMALWFHIQRRRLRRLLAHTDCAVLNIPITMRRNRT